MRESEPCQTAPGRSPAGPEAIETSHQHRAATIDLAGCRRQGSPHRSSPELSSKRPRPHRRTPNAFRRSRRRASAPCPGRRRPEEPRSPAHSGCRSTCSCASSERRRLVRILRRPHTRQAHHESSETSARSLHGLPGPQHRSTRSLRPERISPSPCSGHALRYNGSAVSMLCPPVADAAPAPADASTERSHLSDFSFRVDPSSCSGARDYAKLQRQAERGSGELPGYYFT